jgi:hypothetical protein
MNQLLGCLFASSTCSDLCHEIGSNFFRLTASGHGWNVKSTFICNAYLSKTKTFFLDPGGVWGHGPRRQSTDIDVVSPAGNESHTLITPVYGSHHCDVREVRTPGIRVVAGPGLARLEFLRTTLDQVTNRFAHGSEVDGNVGCIGYQSTICIKNRTRKVSPFSDAD